MLYKIANCNFPDFTRHDNRTWILFRSSGSSRYFEAFLSSKIAKLKRRLCELSVVRMSRRRVAVFSPGRRKFYRGKLDKLLIGASFLIYLSFPLSRINIPKALSRGLDAVTLTKKESRKIVKVLTYNIIFNNYNIISFCKINFRSLVKNLIYTENLLII